MPAFAATKTMARKNRYTRKVIVGSLDLVIIFLDDLVRKV